MIAIWNANRKRSKFQGRRSNVLKSNNPSCHNAGFTFDTMEISFINLNFDDYIGIGHVILGYVENNNYPPKVIKEGRVYQNEQTN